MIRDFIVFISHCKKVEVKQISSIFHRTVCIQLASCFLVLINELIWLSEKHFLNFKLKDKTHLHIQYNVSSPSYLLPLEKFTVAYLKGSKRFCHYVCWTIFSPGIMGMCSRLYVLQCSPLFLLVSSLIRKQTKKRKKTNFIFVRCTKR